MNAQCFTLPGTQSRGQGEMYVARPAQGMPARWVLAVHGSGRSALSYRDVPFYAHQRDMALGCGLGFAVISLGADVWARPEGLHDLTLAHDWLMAQGQTGGIALWATSAGGSQMFRCAQRWPERVSCMLGIFPVWDLEACAGMESCLAAWNVPPDRLPALLAERNPARYQAPTQPMVLCVGKNDRAVPPDKHARALAALRPLDLYETADAHSIKAWPLYETPLLRGMLMRYARGDG